MKTILTITAIIASACLLFGETVWTHPEKGSTKIKPKSVELNGQFIYEPSDEQLESAGWTSTTYEYKDVTNVVDVPLNIYVSAIAYKTVMESAFGEGAHLNTNLTEEVVFPQIALSTNFTHGEKRDLLADYTDCKTWAGEELQIYTMWEFPYGQWSVDVTNKVRVLREDG